MMSHWTRALLIAGALLIVSLIAWVIFAISHQVAHEGAKFYFDRGLGEEQAGNHTNAIADFDRALRLDSKFVEAYAARAQAKNADGDAPGALADLTHAIQLNPKYAPAYRERGIIEAGKPDLDHAIVDLNRAVELEPRSAQNYWVRSSIDRVRDDLEAALQDSNRAIELDPKKDALWRERSLVKFRRGDTAGARADIDKAIELNPDEWLNFATRSAQKTFLNDPVAGLEDANHAVEVASDNPDALQARSWAREANGNLAGALEDINQALQLNPEKAITYFYLGNAQYVNRDWPNALKSYQQFLARPGDSKDYGQFCTWLVLARTGRRQEADAGLARYLEKRPSTGPDDWSAKVGEFLLGHLSADQLLPATKSRAADTEKGRLCELWHYAGMKSLLDGDQASAIEDFKKCMATERRDFIEYSFARAELKTLQP